MRTSSLSHLGILLRNSAGVRVYPFEGGLDTFCDAENTSQNHLVYGFLSNLGNHLVLTLVWSVSRYSEYLCDS